jgi:hypothetical protein
VEFAPDQIAYQLNVRDGALILKVNWLHGTDLLRWADSQCFAYTSILFLKWKLLLRTSISSSHNFYLPSGSSGQRCSKSRSSSYRQGFCW